MEHNMIKLKEKIEQLLADSRWILDDSRSEPYNHLEYEKGGYAARVAALEEILSLLTDHDA